VILPNWQDELVNFNRSFPFNTVNRNDKIKVYAIISPGEANVPQWRENFWIKAQMIWSDKGDIWLSKRLLSPRPRAEWNWVEGDDPRVSWGDLYLLFSQLQTGQAVGNDDGFVLLLPSAENRSSLSRLADEHKGK
jgi:hypothetical protein